ncbi:MAG: peptidylprolyl isomerase [Treponema sp.]|nr:peptidylprolyl isomerase [Treponema sp.]
MKRIIFVFLGLFIAVSGFSQADLQPAATVNLIRTEPITVRQLRTEVVRMEQATGRSLTQAERLQVLDVMINERLVLQAAERDRITVTENEVNQQIQQLRAGMAQQLGRQPTDAEFAQAVMNESGLDVSTFREQFRRQLIVQKFLLEKKGTLINSVRVPTDAEILAEYNLLRSELVRPETIRISMIQVPYGPDAASRTRARTLADSLIREIGTDPSKFDEVAARSVSPNSGFQAGDAGYLPRNQEARALVGQAFMDAAFSLRQGQVSRLIEGQQGFQIIKVTENYAVRNLELNDIMQLGTRITVREYLGQLMLNQRQQAILAQASQELVSELRTGRSFQVFENNIRW